MSVPDGWGATAGWPPWATTDPEGAPEPAAAPVMPPSWLADTAGDMAPALRRPTRTVPPPGRGRGRRSLPCRARCPPPPPRPPLAAPSAAAVPAGIPLDQVHVPLRRGPSGRLQLDPRSMVRHPQLGDGAVTGRPGTGWALPPPPSQPSPGATPVTVSVPHSSSSSTAAAPVRRPRRGR